MVRHSLTVASILALVSACGVIAKPTPLSATASTAPTKSRHPTKAVAEKEVAEGTSAANAFRQVGDYHVYQYTGSFSKQPLTLTEQVVGKDGDALLVDFVLEEGEKMTALRVSMHDDGEVLGVRRITDDGDVPATMAEYDAMMKRTELLPDSNDEMVATDHTSCLIGDEQVDCDMTTYMVTLSGKHAKLMITKSPRVPGRDIGGDIVADDGKVLYSARLIERGNEPPVSESMARLDRLETPSQ
ncbi:MAG TPA: hypothetical protein VH062_14510 [Polyangiaceae bacterium]|jgi:hypothetical protein|nr:hypothetical protein [Polyangiaceae bacterium]